MERPRSVRILGHHGRFREGPSGAPSESVDTRATLVWEGAVDGPGLARILRTVLSFGSLPCDVDGTPYRLEAGSCWYDAAHGALLIEVRGQLQGVV